MAEKLGEVSIYIPKGQIVYGVVLLGVDRKPLGASGIKPIRPADGDLIQVEVLHPPEE